MLNPSIIEPIEARLAKRPGPRSQLSVKALLAGIIVNAIRRRPYSGASVAETLNGLTPDEAAELGLVPADLPKRPVSNAIVRTNMKLLEETLGAGWTADGQKYDLEWFTAQLLAASVPTEAATGTDSVTIARTDFPAWAKPRPDSENGHKGQDGRIIPSRDPDARLGWRSHTADRPGDIFLGYDAFIAVQNHDNPYLIGLRVDPAATEPGNPGADIVDMARRIAPHTREVIADRGFTSRSESFTRPLSEQGINIVAATGDQRVRAEAAIAALKAGRGLRRETCRRTGLAAHHMAALAAAVAHNLRLARRPGNPHTDSQRQAGHARRDEAERANRELKSRPPGTHDKPDARDDETA